MTQSDRIREYCDKGIVYTEEMDRAALRDPQMNSRKRYLLTYLPQYSKKLLKP